MERVSNMLDLEGVDKNSVKLGMILAFCEIVMQGVKQLALSPVLELEEWEQMKENAQKVAAHFNVKSYVETDFLSTDLAPDEAVKGKVVVLYYVDDQVLEAYLTLKRHVVDKQAQGLFDQKEFDEASIAMRRLLSYSEEAIAQRHPTVYGV